MEIMGIELRTIVKDNVAIRCDGCLEVIDGTPWRVNLLDIVASEAPVAWTERPTINPGPFQFHRDASHVRKWMESGYGRPLGAGDACSRQQLEQAFAGTGGNILDLMIRLTQTEAFLYRPVP